MKSVNWTLYFFFCFSFSMRFWCINSNCELTDTCFHCQTADARLRIVSERVDFTDNLIISVSVIWFFNVFSIVGRYNINFTFRLIVLLYDSDRSPQFIFLEISRQKYMECERRCRFCFSWQISSGILLLSLNSRKLSISSCLCSLYSRWSIKCWFLSSMHRP